MANETVSVMDPSGQIVFFIEGTIPERKEEDSDVYDDIASVISKPALIIESANDPAVRYYFRSVGWHRTLLIQAGFRNGRWETEVTTRDPSGVMLSHIIQNGNQLYDQSTR